MANVKPTKARQETAQTTHACYLVKKRIKNAKKKTKKKNDNKEKRPKKKVERNTTKEQ